jgi:ParB/RepB/Spo0J family partition protein
VVDHSFQERQLFSIFNKKQKPNVDSTQTPDKVIDPVTLKQEEPLPNAVTVKAPLYDAQYININKIQVKKNIPCEQPDIEELAESIKCKGLIQPLIVYKKGDDYIVKAGRRRLMALRLLSKTIPSYDSALCIITNNDDSEAVRLIENVQREDLSEHDFLMSIKELHHSKNMTYKEIAEVAGKSENAIKNLFSGTKAPEKDKKPRENTPNTIKTVKDGDSLAREPKNISVVMRANPKSRKITLTVDEDSDEHFEALVRAIESSIKKYRRFELIA